MRRFIVLALALSLVGLTAAAPAEAAIGYRVFEFRAGGLCDKKEVDARVQNGAGLPDSKGSKERALVVRLDADTSTGCAGGVQITGVNGIVINNLQMDIDNTCEEGAPRFVITTQTNATYAFTCNPNPPFGDGDICEPLPSTSFERCTWEEDNAEPLNQNAKNNPDFNFGGTVVKSIAVVFDVQGETSIDNIRINDQLIDFGSGK